MNQAAIATLRGGNLRATAHRTAIVTALIAAKSPITAEEMHARIKGADLVTIYRNLQSLVAAAIAREVRFKDGVVRYELADEHSHHHHLVCTKCGTIDELEGCDATPLEKVALKASKRFASVDEHALEFFGTCVSCAKE